MTSVRGDGQQQEQDLSGSDASTYFSLALRAVAKETIGICSASCGSYLNSERRVVPEFSPYRQQ